MELFILAGALIVLFTAVMLAFDLYLAPVVMIAIVAAAGWLTNLWDLASLIQHAVVLFAPYLAVGCVWSLVKWYIFLKKERRRFDELETGRVLYPYFNCSDNKSSPESPAYAEQLEKIRPRASENKARITAWIAYWPASLVETLLRDSVRLAYEFVAGTLDRMSKAVFS
jgi:hypothetical protein